MKTSVRWKSAVRKTLASLKDRDELEEATVVLVGSIVRGVAGPESDIDLLVVSPERIPRLPMGGELQVFRLTREDFMRRLECGDDFPHWALRYGEIIADKPQWWKNVQQNPAVQEWPDWTIKREQARDRLRYVTPLRESGDFDNAREELRLAARHLARGILLKEGVFPLSQPELPDQLREISHGTIAALLDSLVQDEVEPPVLEEAERTLITYMEKLSS